MTLSEYLETANKRGEMARLSREARLDYSTVWKIAQRGYRLRDYKKAKALSEATGGQVSIEELCEPVDAAQATGTEG